MKECIDFHYRKKTKKDIFSPAQNEVYTILSLPFFNRYSDKTQVFYLMENDDITHRSHHVNSVSFISRTIASQLGLNISLCEAISLSHDIGHPPFAHSGERFLDRILYKKIGIHFNHALQSVRVLDKIFLLNLSLETLCAILCHCGFLFDDNGKIDNENFEYKFDDFATFDEFVNECYKKGNELIKKAVCSTMEGRIVRISDIISYVFRDREDAKLIGYNLNFDDDCTLDSEKELMLDVIKTSKKMDCIAMSKKNIDTLMQARKKNFELIYSSSDFYNIEESVIFPLFEHLFMKLLGDLKKKDESSIIYKHHINYIEKIRKKYVTDDSKYYKISSDLDYFLIVQDFISSMSDDYFISICKLFFPTITKKMIITGYFDGFNPNKKKPVIVTPSLFDVE